MKALAYPLLYREMVDESLSQIVDETHAEKNMVVSDCAKCAYPCGNTSDYDIEKIYGVESVNREIKKEIISECKVLAAESLQHSAIWRRDDEETITGRC